MIVCELSVRAELRQKRLVQPVSGAALVLVVLSDCDQIMFLVDIKIDIGGYFAQQGFPIDHASRNGKPGTCEHRSVLFFQRFDVVRYECLDVVRHQPLGKRPPSISGA
jgi:hypothetical protein